MSENLYDCFVSYSRNDFDEVNVLLQKIHAEIPALKYWFDLDGIESGDEFISKISSAIDNSDRLLFIVSDNSVNSSWTMKEVKYAFDTGKCVLPVLLKDSKLKGPFLFLLGNIDTIDTQAPPSSGKTHIRSSQNIL